MTTLNQPDFLSNAPIHALQRANMPVHFAHPFRSAHQHKHTLIMALISSTFGTLYVFLEFCVFKHYFKRIKWLGQIGTRSWRSSIRILMILLDPQVGTTVIWLLFHDDLAYSNHRVDCSWFAFKHTSGASLYSKETGDVLKQMEPLLPCFFGFFTTFRDNEHGCLPKTLKTLVAVRRAPRES